MQCLSLIGCGNIWHSYIVLKSLNLKFVWHTSSILFNCNFVHIFFCSRYIFILFIYISIMLYYLTCLFIIFCFLLFHWFAFNFVFIMIIISLYHLNYWLLVLSSSGSIIILAPECSGHDYCTKFWKSAVAPPVCKDPKKCLCLYYFVKLSKRYTSTLLVYSNQE